MLDMYVFIIPLSMICLLVVGHYLYKRNLINTEEKEIMVCEIVVDGMTIYEPEIILAWNQLTNGEWGDNVQARCIPMKKKYFED